MGAYISIAQWLSGSLCTSAHLLKMPLDTQTKGESQLAYLRDFANSPSLHSWLLCAWNAYLKLYLRGRIP